MFSPEPDVRKDAPQGLFLSRKGNWFHDGDQLHHERMCALLHHSIDRDGEELIVTTGRDRLPFVAEEAPFLVRHVELRGAPQSPGLKDASPAENDDGQFNAAPSEIVVIRCSDDEEEVLTLAHRFVATANGTLFLSIKKGRFWARLTRGAQQWLEPFLRHDDENEGFYFESPVYRSGIGREHFELERWPLNEEGDEFDPAAHP